MTNNYSSNKTPFLTLFIILVLGFSLRHFHIDHSGIWLDEKISLSESNGFAYLTPQFQSYFTTDDVKQKNTLKNVIDATIKEDGGNGILYILKLHYWQKLFGSTDTAIRMLSLIFSLLLIPVGYYFSLLVFKSNHIAIITSILCAFHPMLIHYAQEARPYSMATLFSCLSTLFFYKGFFNSTNSRNANLNIVVFGFFSLLSMLTHYLTVYIFLAQGFYFLLFVRDKNDYLKYITCWLCVLAAFAFWMFDGGLEGLHYMSLHNQRYTQQLNSLKEGENMFLLRANFKNMFLGWMQQLLAIAGNTLQHAGFRLRMLTVLLTIPTIIIITGIKKNIRTEKSKLILLMMLLFSSSVYATALAILAGHTISFQPGYGIFAAPYFIMLIAFGIDSLLSANSGKLKNFALTGSFAFLISISLYFQYSSNKRTYSDTEPNPLYALSKKIEKETSPNDTIIFPSYTDALIVNFYLRSENALTQVIDSTTNGKVLIKNSKKVLFDFENGKYRY